MQITKLKLNNRQDGAELGQAQLKRGFGFTPIRIHWLINKHDQIVTGLSSFDSWIAYIQLV